MKNQNGFSAIMLSMVVLLLILSLMGSAGIYFQSLYAQVNRQKRQVSAQLIFENIGRLLQTARYNYDSGTGACRAGTSLVGPKLCLSGSSGRCVRYALGGQDHQVCLGAPNGIQIVFQEVEPQRNMKEQMKYYYYAFKRNFSAGLLFMVSQIQNTAEAQSASQTALLPGLGGAPTARFSTGLNCSVSAPDATYCRRCEGLANSNLEQCVRVRVCLRPGGCGTDDHWIKRVFGFLNRS